MSETVTRHAEPTRPNAFTQDVLGWEPWLEPKPLDALTETDHAALSGRSLDSTYFRLLVRDPIVLGARTRADIDIFTNEDGGLPRAERELSAVAASRVNGCLYCAAVHARAASRLSGRRDDVERLLDEGIDAEQDARWMAIIEAAAALTATPSYFGPGHIAALTATGLDEQAVVDVIQSAAFFNWANRLMLSLGEPTAAAPEPAVAHRPTAGPPSAGPGTSPRRSSDRARAAP